VKVVNERLRDDRRTRIAEVSGAGQKSLACLRARAASIAGAS
jgi:hypothetical protein